jgi:hypothetical protein
MSTLSRIDLALRITSIVVVLTLGLAMLLLVSIMATDMGTGNAIATAATLFVVGCGLLGGVVLLAVVPDRVARLIPGPPLVMVLVRVPTYLCGTVGLFLLLRQIWQVAVPDFLR